MHTNMWETLGIDGGRTLLKQFQLLKEQPGLNCALMFVCFILETWIEMTSSRCEVCKLVQAGHNGLFTLFSNAASFIRPLEPCPLSSVEIYRC